jgi:hypothetical protein
LDRVERFAAPVLAEREHVALVALSSSVRRRGESSGHRSLRVAVAERLQQRGVDADSVDWDAYRREDGRWSVLARYSSGEAQRQAAFLFDLQGRFCLADDDEARWLLGEQTSIKGPQPGRRRPTAGEDEADTEPTLDLSDELALVRAVQRREDLAHPASDAPQADEGEVSGSAAATAGGDQPVATPRVLYPVPDHNVQPDQLSGGSSGAGQGDEADGDDSRADDDDSGVGEPAGRDLTAAEVEAAEVEEESDTLTDAGTSSPLDTLAGMFSAADEDAQGAYGGLSDASAVPETDTSAWEPGIVVDFPVEPSPEPPGETDQEPAGDADQEPAGEAPTERTNDGPPEQAVEQHEPEDPPHPVEKPAPAPGGRRKRAAVPSWDEIMFGGPPRSG